MTSAGAGNGGQQQQKPGSAVTLNRNEWAVATYGAPGCQPYWPIVHMMTMVLFKMGCFYPPDIHKTFNDIFYSFVHISLKQATASAGRIGVFARCVSACSRVGMLVRWRVGMSACSCVCMLVCQRVSVRY